MILMGAIAGVHGVRGEVKVKSFTADPLAIAAYGPLFDEQGRSFALKLSQKAAKDTVVIARIDGVSDRNAAEALKGKRLYAPREALPAIEDATEFYASDLIGLAFALQLLVASDLAGCFFHFAAKIPRRAFNSVFVHCRLRRVCGVSMDERGVGFLR